MKKRIMTLAWLVAALFIGFTNQANAQKTEKLFNGKDLKNWNFSVAKDGVSAEQVFSVQNGLIRISGEPFGYMYTKEKYGNYKLHVEWRWPEGKASNSGIFLLIEDLKKPFPNCIECQLHAGDAGDFVLLGGSDLTEFTSKVRPEFPVVKKYRNESRNRRTYRSAKRRRSDRIPERNRYQTLTNAPGSRTRFHPWNTAGSFYRLRF